MEPGEQSVVDEALAHLAVLAAVEARQALLDAAIATARLASTAGARVAAELAADQAAQDATAARYRSEAAASLVRMAAQAAADRVRGSEPDPISFGALKRASDMASAAHEAATAMVVADAQLASAVAAEVSSRARRVRTARNAHDQMVTTQIDAVAEAVTQLLRAASTTP